MHNIIFCIACQQGLLTDENNTVFPLTVPRHPATLWLNFKQIVIQRLYTIKLGQLALFTLMSYAFGYEQCVIIYPPFVANIIAFHFMPVLYGVVPP